MDATSLTMSWKLHTHLVKPLTGRRCGNQRGRSLSRPVSHGHGAPPPVANHHGHLPCPCHVPATPPPPHRRPCPVLPPIEPPPATKRAPPKRKPSSKKNDGEKKEDMWFTKQEKLDLHSLEQSLGSIRKAWFRFCVCAQPQQEETRSMVVAFFFLHG